MVFASNLGLSFSAASEAAIAAFDRAVEEYLAFGRETGRHLKAALAADPEMVMAHVLRGYFFQLMALPPLLARAQQALESAQSKSAVATSRESDQTTAQVAAEIGEALCEALVFWKRGDFGRVVAELAPMRSRLQRIGGSHTQRDLFTQILIVAAMRAGRLPLARALLAERCALRPHNPEAWRLYADVLGQLGDAGPAARARATSSALAAR
ncbi:MAG: hypothetical protein HY527_18890 [Betaproteobacteria bacterium]|nr:hypothetical protein [Betaproteobacteria bacterium]